MRKTGQYSADEEVDYLAKPKRGDPRDQLRREIVRAFRTEYGSKRLKAIGEILGVSESRISQMLGEDLGNPLSITTFLDHVSDDLHRQRILRRWSIVRLGFDPLRFKSRPKVHAVTAETIKGIDELIGSYELESAVTTAWEAFNVTNDEVLAEQLLDRLAFLYQRLDELGRAMGVARLTAERAALRKDKPRLLWANVLRVRILLCVPNVAPETINPLLEALRRLSDGFVPTSAEYEVFDNSLPDFLELLSHVIFVERRVVKPDSAFLRQSILDLYAETSKVPMARKHSRLLLAARIHFTMGETFQAQELLEQSAEASKLRMLEGCAVLMGRILAKTESVEVSKKYLLEARNHAEQYGDPYHARTIDHELAMLESALF